MTSAIVIVTILGLSVGSFVNVCAYRIPRGLSLAKRSTCPRCGQRLRWFELIPIVSYALLLGLCRSCIQRISIRYPVVELLSAALAVTLFLSFGPSYDFVLASSFVTLMLLVALIDWKHLIIPNELVISGLALGFGLKVLMGTATIAGEIASAVAAFATLFVVRAAGTWLFKKEAMGFGDVKLAAVIGLFLGFQGFLVSLWTAAVMGMTWAVLKRTQSAIRNPTSTIIQSPIPFGSFLAVTSSIVLVFQSKVNSLLDRWWTLMQ